MSFRLYIVSAILVSLFADLKCEFVKRTTLTGLYPPVFTPIDDSGAVNVTVIPAYAKYLKSCGLDGLLVAGITGEGPSLSLDEKMKVLDAWVIAAKPLGLKIFVQVGGMPLPEMLELARYAETIRVDALFILTPLPSYIDPACIEELITELEILARATNLPIFYYDNPNFDRCPIDMPEFFQSASQIPQFKGIRATLDVALQVTASNDVRVDQVIYIARHRIVAGAVLLGFDSFIFAELNIFPGLVKEIINYVKAGDVYMARKSQENLNSLVAAITDEGDYIATLKAAMEIVTGVQVGGPRKPLKPLSKRDIKDIEEILEESDVKTA